MNALVAATLAGALALDPRPECVAPTHVFVAEGDRVPERYRWDAGAPVPFTFRTPTAHIDYGEAGVTPRTRVYLSFNEGSGGTSTEAVSSAALDVRTFGWERGRFGHALSVTRRRARLPIPLGRRDAWDSDWTVELWFRRADPERRGVLLEAPGAVRLDVMRSGRCRLLLGAGDEGAEGDVPRARQLWSDPLDAARRWHHLALVFDREPGQVRLVVDGRVRARRAPALEPAPFESLVVGGSEGPGWSGAVDELRVLDRAASSAELLAREAPPAEGEHVLRLFGKRRAREHVYWVGTLAVPELEGPALAACGARRHLAWRTDANTDSRGLAWTPAVWKRVRTPAGPRARTTHPTVFAGAHRALVFGGEVRDTHVGAMINTADTWVYRMDARRWRRVESPLAPPPSCHQAAAFSPDHELVLYAGGWRNDVAPPEIHDQTWVYRVGAERWERRWPEGVQLPAGAGAALVYHGPSRRFLMFRAEAVLAYDPVRDRWERLPPPRATDVRGRPRPFRPGGSAMVAVHAPTGRVVLFGGEAPRGGSGAGSGGAASAMAFDDTTAVYDVERNEYVVMEPPERPAARVRGAFAYDARRDRFVLFGGVRGQESARFGDLWTYDLAADRWVEVASCDPPGPRGGYYGMAYDPELDLFALLCGREAKGRFLDESWELRFDARARGSATWVFDRAAFPERRVLYARWNEDADPGVRVRWRQSDDLHAWGPWNPDAATAGRRFLQVELTFVAREGPEAARVSALGLRPAAPSAGPAPADSGGGLELELPDLAPGGD